MKVKSNKLNALETQRELDLFRQPDANGYPIEIIQKFTSSGKAFTAACDSSGLDDKQIYSFVGIDAGTFSKIKGGHATLQGEDIAKFCYAVNNRIYIEWCAFQVGCTLVEIKSEAERRADAMEARAKEAENKYKVLLEAFQVRGVPA